MSDQKEFYDKNETINENRIDEKEMNENQQIENEVAERETSNDDAIKKLEAEIDKYKELLLRKAAEFENYKRRTENDQLNLLKYAAESFIIKLLPTVDDLERSIQYMNNDTDVSKIKEGIQLVYNKLMKTLDDQGVKKIESIGAPFNVEYHEALLQRKDDSVEPHTVIEELETGYQYKDRVIRHSKVIVSEG